MNAFKPLADKTSALVKEIDRMQSVIEQEFRDNQEDQYLRAMLYKIRHIKVKASYIPGGVQGLININAIRIEKKNDEELIEND